MIDWQTYDQRAELTLLDAAALWLEIDPDSIEAQGISRTLEMKMMTIFEQLRKIYPVSHYVYSKETNEHAEVAYKSGLRVSRQNLITIAENLEERPKFLYSEERQQSPERQRKDYERNRMLVIKAMLALLEERGLAGKLADAMTELEGVANLDKLPDVETVRNHLKAIREYQI